MKFDDKSLKTIGEVSGELKIPQHVLRFWEKKFEGLNPVQRNKGRRYYTSNDIKLLKTIIDLLYIQKYSISGAIKKLRNRKKIIKSAKNNENLIIKLEEVKQKIKNVLTFGA
tara:strand:- start:58 stop:393 length:336 start_codon:yes stop_codon:yes gene_type:complete